VTVKKIMILLKSSTYNQTKPLNKKKKYVFQLNVKSMMKNRTVLFLGSKWVKQMEALFIQILLTFVFLKINF